MKRSFYFEFGSMKAVAATGSDDTELTGDATGGRVTPAGSEDTDVAGYASADGAVPVENVATAEAVAVTDSEDARPTGVGSADGVVARGRVTPADGVVARRAIVAWCSKVTGVVADGRITPAASSWATGSAGAAARGTETTAGLDAIEPSFGVTSADGEVVGAIAATGSEDTDVAGEAAGGGGVVARGYMLLGNAGNCPKEGSRSKSKPVLIATSSYCPSCNFKTSMLEIKTRRCPFFTCMSTKSFSSMVATPRSVSNPSVEKWVAYSSK